MKLNWSWVDSKTLSAAQTARPLCINEDMQTALFGGSKGEEYRVTLEACNCMAFRRRTDRPCKHIVRLAQELGVLDDLCASASASESEGSKRPGKHPGCFETLSDYVVIDLETTGLNPRTDGIVELAAVRVEDSRVTDTFSTLCNPGIRNAAEAKNHITQAMLEAAPSVDEALRAFLDFVGDSPVVGHNVVAFDSTFVYEAAMRSLNRPFDNVLIDTLRWCEKTHGAMAHHRLEDMCAYYGLVNDQAHRALSDALCTQQLYEKLKYYLCAGEVRAASAVFEGYTEALIRDSLMRITDDAGQDLVLKSNKTGLSVFMFGSLAFSIKMNSRSQYMETACDAAFPFEKEIDGAALVKAGCRFPLACDQATAPVYEDMIRAVYEQKKSAVFGEHFGCCSDFERCSDARECLYKDDVAYKGCYYRKNLEEGRIFYGKNRNQ